MGVLEYEGTGNLNPCCGSTRNNLTPQPKTQVKQARTSQHMTNLSQEPLFSNPPPPMIQDQRKQANIKTWFCFRWLQIHDKTLDVRWLPSSETDYPSLVVKANKHCPKLSRVRPRKTFVGPS
ncbi:hypothetical protein LINPERHAP1_LOCUS24155 [Linum perenne]